MASYFGQFQSFDPLFEKVPNTPLKYLPEIAFRARELIKNRTVAQLESLAKAIDFAVYCHYVEIKENQIQSLRDSLGPVLNTARRFKLEPIGVDIEYDQAIETRGKFFEWNDAITDGGQWVFKDGAVDALGIATAYNSSEVDALKACREYWCELAQEIHDGRPYELFATLALWLLADAIACLAPNKARDDLNQLMAMLPKVMESEFGIQSSPTFYSPAVDASAVAYKAMDALCFAEHLQEIDRLAALNLRQEVAKQEDERQNRSIKGRQLNNARHREGYEAKAKVIEEWERDYSKFPSAEKAGQYFSVWLEAQELKKFEPRTVTGWVREHAKKVGVKFR